MLLSEGLSKLNKKGSLGLRHQELGFHAESKHTVWGVVLKNYRGLFMRTGTHFPGTCSARSELWPPPKGLIPLGGGGSSLI